MAAPIMMMTSPRAAIGVSSRRTRKTPGRMSPSAPSVSQTPMNFTNSPLRCDTAASASVGVTSLNPPAKRNTAATMTCATQRRIEDALVRCFCVVVDIVVSPFGSGWCRLVLDWFHQHVEPNPRESTRSAGSANGGRLSATGCPLPVRRPPAGSRTGNRTLVAENRTP
jgi:hypothetical protein